MKPLPLANGPAVGAALVFALSMATSPCPGARRGERVIIKDWYSVYFAKSRAGYTYGQVVERTVRGRREFHSASEERAWTRRSRDVIELVTTGSMTESARGRLRHFSLETGQKGRQALVVTGHVGRRHVRIQRSGAWTGPVLRLSLPRRIPLLGSYGRLLLLRRLCVKPGTAATFCQVDGGAGRIMRLYARSHGKAPVDLPTGPRRLHRVTVEDRDTGQVGTSWLDDEGRVIHEDTGALGISYVRATAATALAPIDFGRLPDFLKEGVGAPLDYRFLRPWDVRRADYRLRGPQSIIARLNLPAGGPRVLRRGKGYVDLRVHPAFRKNGISPFPLPHRSKWKEYCAPDSFADSDAPTIAPVARRIVGSERDAYRAAKRIEAWVHGHMKVGRFDKGFVKASEVLKEASGDCTEHAVLFAALARSLGIPVRFAVGYLVLAAKGKLELHAWNEVFARGAWIQIDGTGTVGALPNACHLKLAHSARTDDLPARMSHYLALVGKLRVEVLSYVVDGKLFRPDRKHGHGRIRRGRYENPLLPFTLRIPRRARAVVGNAEKGLLKITRRPREGTVHMDLIPLPVGWTFERFRSLMAGRSGSKGLARERHGGRPALAFRPGGGGRIAVALLDGAMAIRLALHGGRGRRLLDESLAGLRFSTPMADRRVR